VCIHWFMNSSQLSWWSYSSEELWFVAYWFVLSVWAYAKVMVTTASRAIMVEITASFVLGFTAFFTSSGVEENLGDDFP